MGKYKGKTDVDGALMNIAFIYYQELKDKEQAKRVIQRLIKEFPQSRHLKTATAMLEAINAASE